MAAEYKDKESFEEFFKQTYIPLDYASIQNEMREAASAGWELFTEDYQEIHKMSKNNYILYMTSDAYCSFEEIVEVAVDELNSGIADVVMEIGNEIDFDNSITEIYFDTIEQTLKEMLDALYDDVLAKLC